MLESCLMAGPCNGLNDASWATKKKTYGGAFLGSCKEMLFDFYFYFYFLYSFYFQNFVKEIIKIANRILLIDAKVHGVLKYQDKVFPFFGM